MPAPRIRVDVTGAGQLAVDLSQVNVQARPVLQAVKRAALLVERTVQSKLVGGNPLHVRTGRLRQSVTIRTTRRGRSGGPEAFVGPQRVVYARIHEFGGVILPKRGGYLTFPIGNSWVRVRRVRMPRRPYLAPSARETASRVAEILADGLLASVRRRTRRRRP